MTLSFYPEYSAKRLKCFLVNSGKHMGYWEYHHLFSWESLTWVYFSKLFPILHLITSYRKKTFLFPRTSSDMSTDELTYWILNSIRQRYNQEGCIFCLNLSSQIWLLITVKPDIVLGQCRYIWYWRQLFPAFVPKTGTGPPFLLFSPHP